MNTTIEFETQQTRAIEHKIVMDVQNITKILPLGREQIEILKGISFRILSGEFVSIVWGHLALAKVPCWVSSRAWTIPGMARC